MKVWVPETIPAKLLADLPKGVSWDYLPRRGPLPPGREEVVFLVPNYGLRQRLAEVLPALPRLEVVQTLSAGVDWIVDLIPPGVVLADARGVHDVSVAEWVISAMLALAKETPRFTKAQQEERWIRWGEVALDELASKTVLIVGYGSIGRALEARLRPFGVRILRLARRARAGVFGVRSLLELLPDADVVVLLLPLTPETRGIVDERFLSRMRPGAWLINAGRGALVDTEALVAALKREHIRAALDVTDPEPLPAGHPLWRAPGLLLTPHVAGATSRFLPRAVALLRAQIRRFLEGRPLWNVVKEGY